MTKEKLKKEAIQYAVDYPTSYGKGYKHKDLRIAYLAGAEPREKRIEELEAQIEKMKNCKNCANYMISGKCPSFFRTGWCKNWEMTKK